MTFPEGYITLEEARKLLNYKSLSSIHRLAKKGIIKKHRLLGRICVRQEDIKNLLNPTPIL